MDRNNENEIQDKNLIISIDSRIQKKCYKNKNNT